MNQGAEVLAQAADQVRKGERPAWLIPAGIFAVIITVLAGAAAPGLGLAFLALILFAGVIFEYVLWLQKEQLGDRRGTS